MLRRLHATFILAARKTYLSCSTSAYSQHRLSSFRAMARTYDGALERLATLQSNKAITALFDTPKPEDGMTQDLNALAIPEMLAWIERAGIETKDLSKLKCIHVAGTKGKGSVCAYLTSILTQPAIQSTAGRVGTYTSPHLITVRERIQLDGSPITQQLFAKYFFEVWDAFTASARVKAQTDGLDISEEDLEGPGTKPFFFRFLTILAFHVFLKEGVKSAIIECGIGGEYDSTNVLPAEAVTATVVTQLDLDHVGMLGGTLEEIAWHKTGICKKERACFTVQNYDPSILIKFMPVIQQRAQAAGAELIQISDHDTYAFDRVQRSAPVGTLEGDFQRYNRALAVCAAREHLSLLPSSDAKPNSPMNWLQDVPQPFIEGLSRAKLRGRCETKVEGPITWYIDGAHTVESLIWGYRWFNSKTKPNQDGQEEDKIGQRVLLWNQQDRKNASILLSVIAEGSQRKGDKPFDHAIFSTNEIHRVSGDEPPRDLQVQEMAKKSMATFSPGTKSIVTGSVEEALEEIRKLAKDAEANGERTAVLVTGSLYLVGAVVNAMEPDAEK